MKTGGVIQSFQQNPVGPSTATHSGLLVFPNSYQELDNTAKVNRSIRRGCPNLETGPSVALHENISLFKDIKYWVPAHQDLVVYLQTVRCFHALLSPSQRHG